MSWMLAKDFIAGKMQIFLSGVWPHRGLQGIHEIIMQAGGGLLLRRRSFHARITTLSTVLGCR